MKRLLLLAIAGGAGTVSRYALGGWIHQLFGVRFPFGTFVVNAVGCLVIGFLGTLLDEREWFSPDIRTSLFLGFLGAFTTYSSFAYESWALFKEGDVGLAALNVFGTMIFCFIGLFVGVVVARLL